MLSKYACVPVLLLCFFDQLFEFIDPVGCQPAHYHILHCLHHFTFLTTLPPKGSKCIISLRNCCLANTVKLMCQTVKGYVIYFSLNVYRSILKAEITLSTHFGASVVSRSSEYLEAQCCEESKEICDRTKYKVANLLRLSWLSSPCSSVLSYLLREPVRWSPRFCKGFDGSTDRHPAETKMIRRSTHIDDLKSKRAYFCPVLF